MLGQQALDVEEQLFGLVPAIEDPNSRRAPASRVGRDHDRHLWSKSADPVRAAQRACDIGSAIEQGEIEVRVVDRLGELLGRRQLVDLELSSLEEKACQLEEARIAARDEDARPGLRSVFPCRACRVSADVGGAPRRPSDPVANLETAPVAFAGCELDDLPGAPEGRGAPWPEVALDRDDDLIRVEKDDVDREMHEMRVNRERGTKHHPLAGIQSASSEQPAEAAMSAVGDDAPLTDDPSVFAAERQCSHDLQDFGDVDHGRHQKHDHDRRKDEEDKWEEKLDRHLLRLLLRDGLPPFAHLGR